MNMTKKRFIILFTAIAVISLTPLSNATGGYTSEEWAVILNLSGKQRMLTQKLSKEMLLVAAGVDVEFNRSQLKKTAALFDRTLKGLQNGDKEFNLLPAKSAISKKTLQKVESIWSEFKAMAEAVAEGGDVSTTKVVATNLPLLSKMNLAVRLFEKEAIKEIGGKSSLVINFAGRQRMLTQKMSKEMLMIYLSAGYRPTLEKTVEWFDVTLKSLRNGGEAPRGRGLFATLPPTSQPVILKQLDKVKTLWNMFKPLALNVNRENLEKMAAQNMPLLMAMDKVVEMYEKNGKPIVQTQNPEP